MMKIALIPNMTRRNTPDVTKELLKEFEKLGVTVFLDESFKSYFGDCDYINYCSVEEYIENCEIVVTVGGDGTFIKSAKLSAEKSKPLLCINAGKLAYLAGLESSEFSLLQEIVNGNFKTEKRMMLTATIIDKSGKILYHSNCLNDAVVSRSGNIRIMKLSINCNDAPLMDYRADGVIVSTPTGSTAYSLSAGGPIVDPELESILMTPICPHSLVGRSLVFRPNAVLGISSAENVTLCLSADGAQPQKIEPGCRAEIAAAEFTADFIRIKSENFIDILYRKLAQRR